MLKNYYTLTKPGIIYGNAITYIAGFFIASSRSVDYKLMVIGLIGISLVIASGCVFNNFLDKDIDGLMERTRNRSLVKGVIQNSSALVFAFLLAVAGFCVLAFFTNILTVYFVALGFFVYVFVYSMWLKRSSTHSTLIGSIAGATPIVAGYVTVTERVDHTALVLFFIMALWQMPHFFAIAIYRLEDYKSAKIPVLPVKKTIHKTKIQILLYLALFVSAVLFLPLFSNTGHFYSFVMIILGLWWSMLALKGFFKSNLDDKNWARKVFFFSIIVLVVFSLLLIFRF